MMMPSVEELRRRYADYSDLELEELAASSGLTSDSRLALAEEMGRRRIAVQSEPVSLQPSVPTSTWHRGWLSVFQVLVALVTLAFVGGAIVGNFSWSVVPIVALGLLPTAGIILISRRSTAARPFWLALLGIALILSLSPLLTGGSPSMPEVAWTAIWFGYWLRSKRVREEFGRSSAVRTPAS